MDVMYFLNWTKVAIVYEEDQGTFCSALSAQLICRPARFSYNSMWNRLESRLEYRRKESGG